MLLLIDTDTRELLARFTSEALARLAGKAISEETHRPVTVTTSATATTRNPVARFVDGEEIHRTATIHYLD